MRMAASSAIWNGAASSTARWNFCPTTKTCANARTTNKGLTRPELAVLLAYAKLDLDAEIVASDLPDDPTISQANLPAISRQPPSKRFPDGIAAAIACAAKSSPPCSPTASSISAGRCSSIA